MAKGRGGRPKKAAGEKGTRHVRVFEDLADMIGWIYHFESQNATTTISQILDPMLRDQVIERYAPYAETVKKMNEAQAAAPKPKAAKTKAPKKPS